MEAKESSPKRPVNIITPEAFGQQVSTFPKDAQEAIASLSSLFLEPDIREKISKTPTELELISADLRQKGLSDKEVNYILRYFDLPQVVLTISGKKTEELS